MLRPKALKEKDGLLFSRILGLIKVQRKIDDHEEGSSSLHPAGELNTRVRRFNQAALAAVCPCLERLLIYMFLVQLAPSQMLSAVPRRKGGESLVVVSGSLFEPAAAGGGGLSCKVLPSRTH